jgi:anti-sigma regulatory factor (Ser/Thr protein kinase)
MTDPETTVTAMSWPLRSNLAFGALPSAVPCARLHTKHVLYEWGLEGLGETVELIVSELVTNGLKATEAVSGPVPPPIRLRLSSDRSRVLVEVWDGSTQPPVLIEANAAADSGRGLLLVDTLSTRWNWYFPREMGGKVVWAEVADLRH